MRGCNINLRNLSMIPFSRNHIGEIKLSLNNKKELFDRGLKENSRNDRILVFPFTKKHVSDKISQGGISRHVIEQTIYSALKEGSLF